MSSLARPADPDEEAVMTRYGITRVPAYQYLYKTFRYSKLSDALAQVQRDLGVKNKIDLM